MVGDGFTVFDHDDATLAWARAAHEVAVAVSQDDNNRAANLRHGDTWFVEIKRPKGGVLSPMQDVFAEEMWGLKQKYACLWTIEDVMQWIADL